MARQLEMAQINAIQTLHASAHSNREIARLVGVHRETVAKYIGDQAYAKGHFIGKECG